MLLHDIQQSQIEGVDIHEFTVLLTPFTHDLCVFEGHFILILCVLL